MQVVGRALEGLKIVFYGNAVDDVGPGLGGKDGIG